MHEFSLGNFFDWGYWFGKPLTASSNALWAMGILFTAIFLFGLYSAKKRKEVDTGIQRGVWRRFAQWGITFGILGWVFWLARYETMLIFRRRYWMLLWFLAALWWLRKALRHAKHRAPALNAEAKQEAFRERYLPKRKNK